MVVTYKDINLLTSKSAIAGDEKIPVSDTEYITTEQISEFVGSANISGADSLADIALVDNDYEEWSYSAEDINDSLGYYMMLIPSTPTNELPFNDRNRSAAIYIEPGDIIKIQANSTNTTRFAFVQDARVPHNGSSSTYTQLLLAENTTSITIGANKTKYFKAPEDAHNLVVYRGGISGGNTNTPTSIIVYRKKVESVATGRQVAVLESNSKIASDGTWNRISRQGGAIHVRQGYSYMVRVVYASGSGNLYYQYTQGLPGQYGNISFGSNDDSTGQLEYRFRVKYSPHDCYFSFVREGTQELLSVEAWEFCEDESGIYGIFGNNYAIASKLKYEQIDLANLTARNYSYLNSGLYGATNTYKHYVIPVQKNDILKVIVDSEHQTTNGLCWLSNANAPTANGLIPSAGNSRIFANYRADGMPMIVVAPEGANYLGIYVGKNNAFFPSYVGIVRAGSASNTASIASDHLQTLRNSVDTRSNAMGLIPLEHDVDSNGWELPTTVQQLNSIKKSLQMLRLKWTPKATLPGKNDPEGQAHKVGVEQTGVPYSGNWHEYKYVGIEVSIHTFMTAVNNPYSLLYTENISIDASRSAWGKTYYETNGWMYYGTVCCGFTAGVNGQFTKYGNTVIPKNAEGMGNFVRIWDDRDVNNLRLADVYDNSAHSFLIFGLHRDANGNVDIVRKAESTGTVNSCRTVDYAPSAFYTYVDKSGDFFHGYRVADLYKNTGYEPSPYVPLTEYGESAQTVTYNNDICCFAGDKACFMEGDRIAINYNLCSTPSHTWTSMEIYKDDVLTQTVSLSSINQSALDVSQRNHAVDLGTTLTYGLYKARMTDGTNYSDYTYWEVLQNAISVSDNGDGSYMIKNDTKHRMRYVYLGQHNGNFFNTKAGREPIWPESYSGGHGQMRLYFDALLNDWGYDSSLYGQVRVALEGQYGIAATPPVSLPRRNPGSDSSEEEL